MSYDQNTFGMWCLAGSTIPVTTAAYLILLPISIHRGNIDKHSALFYLILPCSTLFFLILPYSTLFYLVLPYSSLYFLILPPISNPRGNIDEHSALFHLNVPYSTLLYLILPYSIFFYTFFYPFLPFFLLILLSISIYRGNTAKHSIVLF